LDLFWDFINVQFLPLLSTFSDFIYFYKNLGLFGIKINLIERLGVSLIFFDFFDNFDQFARFLNF